MVCPMPYLEGRLRRPHGMVLLLSLTLGDGLLRLIDDLL